MSTANEPAASPKRFRIVPAVLALVEIAAVLALWFFLVRALFALPAVAAWRDAWPGPVFNLIFRWLPLVLIAAIAEAVLRRRSPLAWGFRGKGGLSFQVPAMLWALVLGGAVPLALTLVAPPSASFLSITSGHESAMAAALVAAALAGPVLAQEGFVVGFVGTRLGETWPRVVAVIVVAALFALAHADHLRDGAIGIAFVAVMALQGLVWMQARRAGVSLAALMAAHAMLLVAYDWPLWSLAAFALIAVLCARRPPRWLLSLGAN